jgi:hypothetical protein
MRRIAAAIAVAVILTVANPLVAVVSNELVRSGRTIKEGATPRIEGDHLLRMSESPAVAAIPDGVFERRAARLMLHHIGGVMPAPAAEQRWDWDENEPSNVPGQHRWHLTASDAVSAGACRRATDSEVCGRERLAVARVRVLRADGGVIQAVAEWHVRKPFVARGAAVLELGRSESSWRLRSVVSMEPLAVAMPSSSGSR